MMSLLNNSCVNTALEEVEDPRLSTIKVPEGFKVSIFADNVENARSMTRGANGTIFVGTRDNDKVFALVDNDGDGIAEEQHVIAKGLSTPNGVAFKDGSLYVAEIGRILRFDDIEAHLTDPPKYEVVTESYPTDKHHGWKYIGFGPDGKLYVPVGAPCNICESEDSIYASMTRINADGTGREIFSKGIRNSVGFDWHPETGELWFTDNGRDRLGDDIPADELNHAPKKGMHFGYPYCHQGDILDPELGEGHQCSEFTPPAQKLGPHVAALGMKFYTGSMFPAEYRHDVFIAEHGSWNRSTPIGYRVMRVKMENGKASGYEPFAEGWLGADGKAWGRPVDILELPDGSILVSDDFANVIYRISYEG